jgi:hypothetical protein
MKNRLLILTAMFAALCFTVQAQTLSPTVISSSGGFFTSGSAMLSTTVAEMTMVETFSAGSNILTQGFQQPEVVTVGIEETPVVSGDISIYPNPTSGSFVLSFNSNGNSESNIMLYNLAGQMVMQKQVSPISGLNTVNFDISSLAQGMYILELSASNATGEKKSSYHKINLVY